MAALVLLGIVIVAWIFLRTVPEIARCASGATTPFCDYYWFRPGLLWHIAGALSAVMLALVQLWLGLTGRARALHRTLGRAYLFVVASAGMGSLFLLGTLPEPANEPYRYGLIGATLAWMLATAIGYRAARRRDYARHRLWMMRSFTIAMLFVVFRVIDRSARWLALEWFDAHGDDLENVLAWVAWTVPLLVLEIHHRISRAAGSDIRPHALEN